MMSIEGAKRASDLANSLAMITDGITVMTDKPVLNELIQRISDPNDRRVVWFQITNKGEQMVRELQELRAELISLFIGVLIGE